jgi:hypothetical protein
MAGRLAYLDVPGRVNLAAMEPASEWPGDGSRNTGRLSCDDSTLREGSAGGGW